jgi:hypothetical protein
VVTETAAVEDREGEWSFRGTRKEQTFSWLDGADTGILWRGESATAYSPLPPSTVGKSFLERLGAVATAPSSTSSAARSSSPVSVYVGRPPIVLMRQQSVDATIQQLHEVLRHRSHLRTEEERQRRKRLSAFAAHLDRLWESQWRHVQLHELPYDAKLQGKGVFEREPRLLEHLGALLKKHFEQLFDTYLYYAKVEAEESAVEMYRLKDSSWRMLLRDAGVIGEARDQILTTTAGQIFTFVNQRREKLASAGGATPPPQVAAAFADGWWTTSRTADGAPDSAITAAVLHSTTEAAKPGFDAVATRGHYMGGSPFGFTLSEFLEGLVFSALQCYPPPPAGAGCFPTFSFSQQVNAVAWGGTEGAGGDEAATAAQTAAHVLTAVGKLLHERVLVKAKHADVLAFRRQFVSSITLNEALHAVRSMLEPVFRKYDGSQAGTLSLKRFLDMCQDAQLIGTQLSRYQVKMAFVNSLPFSADASDVRKPLLAKGAEFEEAFMRIVHVYSTPALMGSELLTPMGQISEGSPQKSFSAPQFAASVSALMKQSVSAAIADASPADAEMEAAIIKKLPIVLGKLLATLSLNNDPYVA